MTNTRFSSILIANRGEIACRVIRTARALGLRTVAVYSEADCGAPHVALADEAVLIGPGPVGESYLRPEKIIAAAKESGAEAIHPGYGFLSENAAFAQAVADAGLVFIGPPIEAIRVMGDKAGAKRAMIAAGVPCVPGYEGLDQNDATFIAEADKIGFPVMVKASAGGGGRGMRLVEEPADLADALTRARAEALSAFGSGDLILEKAVRRPRHVEIQVFADAHGHVLHFGERDCSVQRRHQKVVEESPSPVVSPELRARMGAAAVEAARAVDYRGAGTVEFLLDAQGAFYFLEMNTRLQVEHPVTEMVTGLDLVALQIAVAQGDPLPLTQDDVRLDGHAIEVRLYAEDPAAGFLPVTGDIALWHPASGAGVRIDAGIVTGQTVSPFYDPMLAKVIAHGPTRDIARRRLIGALQDTAVLGLATNAEFLIDILERPDFAEGRATTAFIGENYPDGVTETEIDSLSLAMGAALKLHLESRKALVASTLPDESLIGFQSAAPLATRLDVKLAGKPRRLTGVCAGKVWTVAEAGVWQHAIEISRVEGHEAVLLAEGKRRTVLWHETGNGALLLSIGPRRFSLEPHRPWEDAAAAAGSGRVVAPMPGLVVSVLVEPGQTVEAGAPLAVLEAMKMQHTLKAATRGTVTEVRIAKGQQLTAGALMVAIEEEAA
ncbi:acetyl/propionyl/methylcrotonyl-CoA carboxylase subunit alpha [Rhizobium sp. C4]|uniref:acetyl/propionyl/methylcrotonyl-CoA carboxylase subunit alpha n=1 Tax=Rhizobium sp. C4 TaxID=1349800 RepID=UPI001E4E9002|nr:acetyl/propionyl/methylcrotonyl-CoA carboxylase subunit alpha [Rhizobium sp. C4]MCD2174856.1 acetyl/propionyl/methylcrotonyl-CoA carboxylase subunit alpha [Rhizobium sp. C4]